ncbi:MAG: T9SS type A sorting domain-containing protein [Ignavibacteriales bacterium]|nr:T9SS type A sorting domain-containing protein [Ignavibacteriales bacterium]
MNKLLSSAKVKFVSEILLVSFIIFISITSAQASESGKGIKVNVLSTTPTSTTLEFILTDYNQSVVKIGETDFVNYVVPGSISFMERGFPQLPIHRASIIIPDLAGMNYRVIDQQVNEIATDPVAPSKGHFTRNIDPETVAYTFDQFYNSNNWYPQTNISTDNPYIIKDLRGLTVQFNPMQYNPAEHKLRICTRLVVEIYSDENIPAVNPLIRTKNLDGISKEFMGIYKSLFINFGYSYYDYVPLPENGKLLIVYPTAFASNITPFVQWKQERGLETLTAEYPTQTGSGSAALKTYIQNLYNSAGSVTFIVLVGESNQIPTLSGQYEGAPSDPSYVKLAGSDAYPDAFISRISPTSSANLDYVLQKLINYEKYPDGGLWYSKGIGVASNEGTPPDYTRASWLKDMLVDDMNFTHVDEIYDPGATATQVTNAINEGRSIINYIGHGSGISWSTTGYGNSHIHQLSNGNKNPFIIDVSCLNGNFTDTECMDEAWLRAGDINNFKGAIAAFGSSTNASWVPPCDMQNHSVSLITSREMKSVGGICFNGIMHAMDLWGGSSGEGLKLMEQYNIFGDCSMLLTFGMIPDSTAPTAVADLTTVNPNSNSVTLNWTAPYDSSMGGVVSYDIRYSTNPIVTDVDFENAPFVLFGGNADTAGVQKSYVLKQLNFSSTYFIAIKAIDLWGNKSIMSNVSNATTWDAPNLSVSPDSLHRTVLSNTTLVDSIVISNISSTNSSLDFSVELTNNTFPEKFTAKIIELTKNHNKKASRNNPIITKGSSFRGAGGPDLFGYQWIDSNDPQGPEYVWEEISTTGTLVTNWIATSTYSALDEGKAGPFNLGFNFKYYGVPYTQVYFCSNGFISFSDITDAGMSNESIPGTDIPNNLIAALWDDLDGKTTGKVYYKSSADKFIVEYKDWPGYYSGTGPFTFQIVLHKNGRINIYYKTILGSSNSSSVGIENLDGTDGLQVVRDASYLANDLALMFYADPEWLFSNNFQGTIFNGNSVGVILNFITDDLELGDYSMDMEITTNDPVNPFIVVPIRMTVTNEVPVELLSFNAEMVDGNVVLNWSTATETNNSGFSVERAVRSQQSPISNWENTGFVSGKGTTTEKTFYSYSDKNEKPGTYLYRLKQIDFDGTFSYSSEVEIEVTGPKDFALYQNYPNPFNPSTTIKFALPVKTNLSLSVYNTLGEKVAEIFNGELEEGYHEMMFNASGLSSGIYFYKIESENYSATKKLMLLK